MNWRVVLEYSPIAQSSIAHIEEELIVPSQPLEVLSYNRNDRRRNFYANY
jgi:hypothetical protein